ncbi:toxin-antitoxin system HicB family antitoxin [Pleurocapsales cyanobacterium LEGE 10410]|nr:toxin-antitoxin system HicB family antitoxin [Pleurocapsales cyanobacterium LEGE 10410]
MSRLTLRLPETLHQQLVNLAEGEGISLNQYIVYALTRQVSSAYTVETISKEDIAKQQENFEQLLAKLEKADAQEIEQVLSQREIVNPEPALTPNIVERLKTKIKKQE